MRDLTTASPLVEAAALLRQADVPGCEHADAVAVLILRLETAEPHDKRALPAAVCAGVA